MVILLADDEMYILNKYNRLCNILAVSPYIEKYRTMDFSAFKFANCFCHAVKYLI